MKKKAKTKKSKKKSQSRIQNSLQKFKKIVESKLGQVNWNKVGIFSLALLLFVAAKGLLGPKAQIIAVSIVKLAAYA